MSAVPFEVFGQILLAPLKGIGFGQAIIGKLTKYTYGLFSFSMNEISIP